MTDLTAMEAEGKVVGKRTCVGKNGHVLDLVLRSLPRGFMAVDVEANDIDAKALAAVKALLPNTKMGMKEIGGGVVRYRFVYRLDNAAATASAGS